MLGASYLLRARLVEILDGITESVRQRYPELVAIMLNGKGRKAILESLAGVTDESQEQKAAMVFEFLNTLRGLFDQWIASGNIDGVENAWERSVHWTSEAYPNPLVTRLMAYEIRNPAEMLYRPDSRFAIGMLPTSAVLPEIWGLVYPLVMAREKAVLLLRNLVNCPSPLRERLSRCDACREYFVRARVPKKDTPIYHGSYCASCKGKGKDRARRTVDSRNQRTQEKIKWAADAWAKWTPDHRHGKRSEWVAEQVTGKLPRGEAIKGNWVTWHRAEIEAEVERRNHAKG